MKKAEYSLHGVDYVFYGPNTTLIDWNKDSELARTVMDASGLELETLFRAFSKNNTGLIAELWEKASGW